MDYTGIIQLIIATIFYSTLVAPNIKKMADLRSEISDVRFPLKTAADYEKNAKELSVVINKKMKQYAAVYGETRKFLRFLYGAMTLVLMTQVATPYVEAFFTKQQATIQTDTVVSSVITLIIFGLLVVAMKIFILKPERIRTFDWLTTIGIAQTYAHDIFNPSLELNRVAKNIRESNNHVNISIASDIVLYGYSIILTIEDIAGEKVYHVVAGRVKKQKYLNVSNNYYPNGQNRAILDLVHSLRLRPGLYRARLLFFETVYPGSRAPSEVIGGFEVTDTVAKASTVTIDLSTASPNYSFKSEKDKPCKIDFQNNFEAGDAIKMLLSVPRFRRYFAKSTKLFSFGDINGMLTYDTISRILHPSRILLSNIRLIMRFRKSKHRHTTHVHLMHIKNKE